MSQSLLEMKNCAERVIERNGPCICGSYRFREAHRLARKSKPPMIMYECVECGEYVL
jgi:hypothetical protein